MHVCIPCYLTKEEYDQRRKDGESLTYDVETFDFEELQRITDCDYFNFHPGVNEPEYCLNRGFILTNILVDGIYPVIKYNDRLAAKQFSAFVNSLPSLEVVDYDDIKDKEEFEKKFKKDKMMISHLRLLMSEYTNNFVIINGEINYIRYLDSKSENYDYIFVGYIDYHV